MPSALRKPRATLWGGQVAGSEGWSQGWRAASVLQPRELNSQRELPGSRQG